MLNGRIGWMFSILKGLGMEVKSRTIWCGLSFVPAFRISGAAHRGRRGIDGELSPGYPGLLAFKRKMERKVFE